MGQLKCTECGQIFNDNMNECPNCACPASVCEKIDDKSQSPSHEKKMQPTTDTGDKYEKIIQSYAHFIFGMAIFISVLLFIMALGVGSFRGGVGGFVVSFFGGGLLLLAIISGAKVMRAFLMVYSNISINLHELNMKNR